MKKFIATFSLMAVLLVSASTARAGILVGDSEGSAARSSCKANSGKNTKSNTDWGIFITAAAGIFITALTGIIYGDGFTRNDDQTKAASNCRS